MLQEESVPRGTRLIDLDVFSQNIRAIFAIQVTLEEADDNEHNKYGKAFSFLNFLN